MLSTKVITHLLERCVELSRENGALHDECDALFSEVTELLDEIKHWDTERTAHDWCPECDTSPGECRPGTCPGRPFPELAEAEAIARGVAHLNPWVVSLLAEYDERRTVRDRALMVHAEQYAEIERLRAVERAVALLLHRWHVDIDDDQVEAVRQVDAPLAAFINGLSRAAGGALAAEVGGEQRG